MSDEVAANENDKRSKLERARRELLDLTFRNRFLNYRRLKSRGLEVADDDAVRVGDLLLDSEAAVTFLTPEEAAKKRETWLEKKRRGQAIQREARRKLGTLSDEDEDTGAAGDASKHPTGKDPGLDLARRDPRIGLRPEELVTDHDVVDLERRLLATQKLARTSIEERGVNTLFVAVGALHFPESETSETIRTAPLALVPATLERANVAHGMRLLHDGEELQGNPTLREYLRQHGIELPLPDEDGDLAGYFDAVDKEIRDKPRWQVDRSHVSVGFFSFTQYLMYLDLDPDRWPDPSRMLAHPVVSALLGDGFGRPAPPALPSEGRLDGHEAYEELHHVLDADGSQSMAVAEAMRRSALVIQGPPGTGKSQTITNLLAEAVAEGQRVLFVAEKKAALDVVKRRLDEVGMGAAALELHSDKATRKAVVEELRATVELGAPVQNDASEVRADRDRLRRDLDAYVDAIHEPIPPYDRTPFQLMSSVRSDGDLPRLMPRDVGIPDAGTWNASKLETVTNVTRDLEAWARDHGPPHRHPFRAIGLTAITPMDEGRIAPLIERLQRALDDVGATDLPRPLQDAGVALNTRREVERTVDASRVLERARQYLPPSALAAASWLEDGDALRAAVQAVREADATREEAEGTFEGTGWTAFPPMEAEELFTYLTARRDVFYRWFSRRYREACQRLDRLGLVKDARRPESRERAAEALRRHAHARARFREHRSSWQRIAPDQADVVTATNVVDVIDDVLAMHHHGPAWWTPQHLERLSRHATDALARTADAWAATSDALMAAMIDVTDALALDLPMRFGVEQLDDVRFEDLREAAAAWADAIPSVHAGARWRRVRTAAENAGLGGIVSAIDRGRIDAEGVTDQVRRAVHAEWLQKAFEERAALARFDVDEHETRVRAFTQQDQRHIRAQRAIVAKRHHDDVPQPVGTGQMGVLLQEFAKKRRHLPIRRLMKQAGTAVQDVKPIFMMSPLSAAVFLPPGTVDFDLVVFDEASQVRPVDAYGALLRGRRAVVVGDDKQLPPTSFFDALIEEDEGDPERFSEADVESVLGLFGARGAPDALLAWHYRSRHESLVAVSNKAFYQNRLLLFPSPDAGRHDLGVRFHHHPETTYDRGGSRTNKQEARLVAEAVRQHAHAHPDRTLGVAALSSAQQRVLDDEVDRLTREDEVLADFRRRHPTEPLFVKNLETVQGDERDVVFVSIGYGKDANGKLHLNFGPLNSEGGERRLNVLTTRARMRTDVFANFTEEDMDPSRCTSKSLRTLREYFAFARTGHLDTPQVGERDDESPFEDAVADALRDAGHHVQRQVGAAGYAIDLAIVHPDRPGRMILGIECDGASYHSSRSARDRDRLREAVLRDLGWRLHRVWSTDWFRDPVACLDRMETAVANALAAARDEGTDTSRAVPGDLPAPRPEAPDVPGHASAASVARGHGRDATDGALPNLDAYVLATPPAWGVQGVDLPATPPSTVAGWVAHVVETEGPVHPEDVVRRVATWANVGRIGNRIRAALDGAIEHGAREGRFRWEGDALVPPDFDAAALKPRDRSRLDARHRKFDRIPAVELDVTIRTLVDIGRGVTEDEVAANVVRWLGFGRTTADMRRRIDERVQALLAKGELACRDAQLVRPD